MQIHKFTTIHLVTVSLQFVSHDLTVSNHMNGTPQLVQFNSIDLDHFFNTDVMYPKSLFPSPDLTPNLAHVHVFVGWGRRPGYHIIHQCADTVHEGPGGRVRHEGGPRTRSVADSVPTMT